MKTERALLERFRQRGAPPARQVALAVTAGVAAALAGTALVVGALTLLVFSAGRPQWSHVIVWLTALELVAFVRSPLRFGERVANHALGFRAVTAWRTWLVRTVGGWSRHQWRVHATGDVLDRALRDSDELQDLWIRGLLPLCTSAATFAIGAGVLAIVSLPLAAGLVVLVSSAGLVWWRGFAWLVRLDAQRRTCRGQLRGQLVGVSAAAAELHLLGAEHVIGARLFAATEALATAESNLRRARRTLALVAPAITIAMASLFLVAPPHCSAVALVAMLWLSFAMTELLEGLGPSVDALVHVIASAQRLQSLEPPGPTGGAPWPTGPLRWQLAPPDEFALTPGIWVAVTGPSGSGKTTFVESVVALGDESAPLLLNGVSLSAYDETVLRQRVRYVPADPGLVRGFVRDTLTYGAPWREELLGQLAAVGLQLQPHDRLEGLSRGERQRFAVVRALATAPDLVVLDEPTSGLGVDDAVAVLDLLARSGAMVIIASHDPAVLARATHVMHVPRP